MASGPLTRAEMVRLALHLWPERRRAEPVALGCRWLAIIDLGTNNQWQCLVAASVPRKGHEHRPELTRHCASLSAARTYLHELAVEVFEHRGVTDESGFGTAILGCVRPP